MIHASSCLLLAGLVAIDAAPAAAGVAASSDNGFASHNEAVVAAAPEAAWAAMLVTRQWWNGEHSYSGDRGQPDDGARRRRLLLRDDPGNGNGGAAARSSTCACSTSIRGSTLRLRGALGPLQAEAVTGVLTMTVEASGTGPRRSPGTTSSAVTCASPMADIAPRSTGVVGEQLIRLGQRLERP